MNEFSAYGSHKAAVKNLVNKDIDAKKFFETLNSRGWSIEYHNRIEDVFEYLFVAGGSQKTNFKILYILVRSFLKRNWSFVVNDINQGF